MWTLLPRKIQTLIVAALAIMLAWGIEGAAGFVTNKPPSELKLISLVATVISVVAAGIASASWRWCGGVFP
jgi:hypothetical protein